MAIETVGVLHPGAMGSSVAAAARGRARVLWVGAGRSDASHRRAQAAGLEDAGDLAALLGAAGLVVSVCPPHAARDQARAVAGAGFTGLYLDANAVSPGAAVEVADIVTAAGAKYVDGGIVGPPAHAPGTTRLYLSGAEAEACAAVFEGSALEPRVIGERPDAASALKMAYAAWTKGSAALLLAVRALAQARDVAPALEAEWSLSQAGLAERAAGAARGNAPKAWRFVGEMQEIARTFEDAGLPGGFHAGAAEIYARLEAFKDTTEVDPAAVIAALCRD